MRVDLLVASGRCDHDVLHGRVRQMRPTVVLHGRIPQMRPKVGQLLVVRLRKNIRGHFARHIG